MKLKTVVASTALIALSALQAIADRPHFRSLGMQVSQEQAQAALEEKVDSAPAYVDLQLDSLSMLLIDAPFTFRGYNPLSEARDAHSLTPPAPILSLPLPEKSPLAVNNLPDSTALQEEPKDPFYWLTRRINAGNLIHDARYKYMLYNPGDVDFIYWRLPDPPRLIDSRKDLTEEVIYNDIPSTIEENLPSESFPIIGRTNWLHTFKGSLQFSQAYLSPNWYQGGNNSLTILANFFWNVKLNDVYHPNLLFDNTLSYNLGVFSTPQDDYHNYSISQDVFQWNFKFGVKATRKWFYSFTAQFKTQFLNNYGENSLIRKASFLSPGALTLGLGMTYSYSNAKKTLKLNASISPLSYNLITCIDTKVDPVQYNVEAGHKSASEYGSNGELTLEWALASNISYRSRLFTFTNYEYFLSDWENTFSFAINRFLSTQIYVHLRYDSSTTVSDIHATKRWRYWMLKEILSFGFAYTFSTK